MVGRAYPVIAMDLNPSPRRPESVWSSRSIDTDVAETEAG